MRTLTKAEKQKDSRLRRLYGISLFEYEKMLAEQNGGCWICGKVPADGQLSLSVDHDHSWKKVKIDSKKTPNRRWFSQATYNGTTYAVMGDTKSEAIRGVKKLLLRASVRRPLCVWCNRGLRFYHDKPELFRNAAKYLEWHQTGELKCWTPTSN